MTTSAQVVETLVTTTDNFPSQESTYPDDQSTLLHILCRGISDHIGLVLNLLNMKQTNNRGEGIVIILNISSSITTNSHICTYDFRS